ncbi:hypothetical protein COCON_G00113820 [Conger conger]|uniref:DUF4515 domain-containing protein n=1 Tax=Conger conger TaxID=82655 RepID=A0A9Q1DGE0_CONCO|nr:hypothetical protein COCON_G00113820 [Conger conger]
MPKKKKEKAQKQAEAVLDPEAELPPPPAETEREAQLRREYDELTDNLNHLKRRVEQLRCENDLLQSEADRMRVDTREYTAYISQRTQKRQSAITTLNEHNQQELQKLCGQRELEEEKHSEQANELKRQVLERESELVLLKNEIDELGEIKRLQKQQLSRIRELQGEMEVTNSGYTESIQGLRTQFFAEKEKYEDQAREKVHTLALAANREATQCLVRHTQQVSQESGWLRVELQELIAHAQVLHDHQGVLQAQRQQLQLELDTAQDLGRLHPAHTAQERCQQEEASQRSPQCPFTRPDPLAFARGLAATTQGPEP